LAYAAEVAAAAEARSRSAVHEEWRHLERAHIVSQPIAILHVGCHARMLGYGLRHRDRREITGQVLRIVVAGPGSLLGRYPVGNTGGADVPATQPMPIPDDLRPLFVEDPPSAPPRG
jgi:hypothetical protein